MQDDDRARWHADPLADRTVARIVGDPRWGDALAADGMPLETAADLAAPVLQRLRLATQALQQWTTNASLATWQPGAELPADIGQALRDYLNEGAALPAWADARRIERAERVFFDQGALSCILLFCASLPECYVLPDLSAVLHTTGQLEDRTDHRVRATAAMIFPIMMRGGLATPEGSGVAQVLKVRLIHATVRHLILRGEPPAAGPASQAVAPSVAPLLGATAPRTMHHALLARGWDTPGLGLPCNQQELVYTLLTFHLVFIRGMRRLHIPLSVDDEQAYLHAWNVMGHVLGIDDARMPQTIDAAQELFDRLQARGLHGALPPGVKPDARPALGRALMNCMARQIPLGLLRPMPTLLTRRLCGPAVAQAVGIADTPVPWLPRLVFALGLGAARVIDALARIVWPQFSLSRFITRLVGYPLIVRFLMDQTRPLVLPEHLAHPMRETVAAWGRDPQAPGWLNAIEDRYTVAGDWRVR
jgi:ER-bound oxygenase mpaB/B'/Rubber oxygenase, catalytic domain